MAETRKQMVLNLLNALAGSLDPEVAHTKADGYLVAYIGDDEIEAAYKNSARKWLQPARRGDDA